MANVLNKPTLCAWSFMSEQHHNKISVPLAFIKKFADQVSDEWELFDPEGNHHIVPFFSWADFGYIGENLQEIRDSYRLKINTEWELAFKGDSQFVLKIFDVRGGHKRELMYPKPEFCFSVTLTRYQASGSQLNIPSNRKHIVLQYPSHEWILRAYNGEGVRCKILDQKNDNKAKFGKGWKYFCKKNQLKEGDTCTFRMDSFRKQKVYVHIRRC